MRGIFRLPVLFAAALLLAAPPIVPQSAGEQAKGVRLPSGKLQRQEILRAEHEKSLKEIVEIRELAAEIEAELEKGDYHVLPVGALKKVEEIERLAKRIRSRLRRF